VTLLSTCYLTEPGKIIFYCGKKEIKEEFCSGI
jgi:hypothetical protein